MSQQNSHHVHRVVLPSGKAIDVIYFADRSAVPPSVEPTPHEDLHVCGSCGSHLVYPIDWAEAGATHWEVTLRCPNCEWVGTGVFEQEAVERFDEELDRGTEVLVGDLKTMVRANMEAEIARFVAALEGDHIQPDDF